MVIFNLIKSFIPPAFCTYETYIDIDIVYVSYVDMYFEDTNIYHFLL